MNYPSYLQYITYNSIWHLIHRYEKYTKLRLTPQQFSWPHSQPMGEPWPHVPHDSWHKCFYVLMYDMVFAIGVDFPWSLSYE